MVTRKPKCFATNVTSSPNDRQDRPVLVVAISPLLLNDAECSSISSSRSNTTAGGAQISVDTMSVLDTALAFQLVFRLSISNRRLSSGLTEADHLSAPGAA